MKNNYNFQSLSKFISIDLNHLSVISIPPTRPEKRKNLGEPKLLLLPSEQRKKLIIKIIVNRVKPRISRGITDLLLP